MKVFTSTAKLCFGAFVCLFVCACDSVKNGSLFFMWVGPCQRKEVITC